MQPENTAQFNPLDFSKLTLQQQFEAARTMNQKELMAVAGAGIPLETLLKYQGLTDAQIKELNPYLASFSAMQEKEASRHQSAQKHSLAQLYAMLQEQGHSNTNASPATGHKLGDITNLSHEQQVHVLAEHFAHGGSYYDAAKSLKATDEQAKQIDEFSKKAKAEIDEKYKEEEQSIAAIDDERKRRAAMEELKKRKYRELGAQLKNSDLEPKAVVYKLAEALSLEQGGPIYTSTQKILTDSVNFLPEAMAISQKRAQALKSGTATEADISSLKQAELANKSADKIQQELQTDKVTETRIIKNFIAADSAADDKVTAALMVAKGAISQDAVSNVKKGEGIDSQKASAEALKATSAVEKTDDLAADIPKPGAIKIASWQQKNAEAKAPAPVNQPAAKLTV